MKIFGYTMIKTEHLESLKKKSIICDNLHSFSYWFNGDKRIADLLHKFCRGEVQSYSIESIRREFFKSFNRDEWGRKINPEVKENE